MRNTMGTIVMAALFAVGTTAQEQPATPRQPAVPAPGQQPATQGEQSQRPQPAATQLAKTTISGCIQNAPPAAPAAGGAAPAAAASKFDLANAKTVTPAPVGTTGTAAVTRYRLEGDDKLLTPHLNHQVEITGTIAPASAVGAAASPALKVESVKMVAATCPTEAR
jgi:hypothetical protein